MSYETKSVEELMDKLRNLTQDETQDIRDFLNVDQETSFEIVLKYIFYVLAMVVAFVGNLCIIVAVLRTRSLRTKFNYYIVNLAVADILMPMFCMWIHLVSSMHEKWVLGIFLCKCHTFIQVTVVCCSVFTLTTVTLDRFLATVLPAAVWITQYAQLFKICVLWIISLSVAVPWIIYQFYAEFDWIGGHEVVCQSKFPSVEARKIYYLSFFTLVFIVPLFLMFTLLVVTVIKGDNARNNGTMETTAQLEMRRKAVYMLLTILMVFCVCWTPQQCLLLWNVYKDRNAEKPAGVKKLHYIAVYFAYISSVFNPVIYYLYNKCFRHALYTLCINRCKEETNDSSVSPATDNDHCESNNERTSESLSVVNSYNAATNDIETNVDSCATTSLRS